MKHTLLPTPPNWGKILSQKIVFWGSTAQVYTTFVLVFQPLKRGHLTNNDTLFCPIGVRNREVPTVKSKQMNSVLSSLSHTHTHSVPGDMEGEEAERGS